MVCVRGSLLDRIQGARSNLDQFNKETHTAESVPYEEQSGAIVGDVGRSPKISTRSLHRSVHAMSELQLPLAFLSVVSPADQGRCYGSFVPVH